MHIEMLQAVTVETASGTIIQDLDNLLLLCIRFCLCFACSTMGLFLFF